jgi:hypothetical protein
MHRRRWGEPLGRALAALPLVLTSGTALADAPAHGYTLTPIAFLGDPAPGGGKFTNDFEPTALNRKGDLAFTADLAEINGISNEGVWLASGGTIIPIVRYGQPAPGGGTFGAGELGTLGLDEAGDLALAFSLKPFPSSPFGRGDGVYRWSRTTQTLTPILVPRVTPAPGGGTFAGTYFNVALNNQGEVAFCGLTATDKGIHVAGEAYVGYGEGVYVADTQGKITAVVSPGDAAPGGSTFDYAGVFGTYVHYLNEAGDVAFAGHRVGDPVGQQALPQASFIRADPNVYVKHAASGQIEPIASVGDPLPDGGTWVYGAPLGLNNAGEVLFYNFPNPDMNDAPIVLYLRSGGQTVRVAGPGDAMPGGGQVTQIGMGSLNNQGDIAFNTALDTQDEGVYLYSKGKLSLIAKTGTAIPGAGTLLNVEQGNSVVGGTYVGAPAPYTLLSDAGQVAFPATLADGQIGLLLATPNP